MVLWPYPPTGNQLKLTVVACAAGAALMAAGIHLSYANIAPQQARTKARSDYVKSRVRNHCVSRPKFIGPLCYLNELLVYSVGHAFSGMFGRMSLAGNWDIMLLIMPIIWVLVVETPALVARSICPCSPCEEPVAA
ncbi:hypothetical protein MLD38_020193 [Melastoma candidum]|uniref:Uncharacterized protein n=1 Tax=Melastoma candidum TaxID=119954 RepID=A0ACB9QCI9_9MYRT|nr:hypothetical protein MLD38_020193 [Melastoma candidum]